MGRVQTRRKSIGKCTKSLIVYIAILNSDVTNRPAAGPNSGVRIRWGSRFVRHVWCSRFGALRDIRIILTGLFARRSARLKDVTLVSITGVTARAFQFDWTHPKWPFSAGFGPIAPPPVGIFERGEDWRVGHVAGHTMPFEWRKSVQRPPSSERCKKSDIKYRSVRHLGSSWWADSRGRHVGFGVLLTFAPRLYKHSGAAAPPLLLSTSTSKHVWTW